MARCRALAEQLVDFLNASPSPFHAVAAAEAKLKAAGFVKISEAREDDFSQFAPGAKLYLTRNQTTLIAFAVGGRWNPGNGFSVVGAHTDSPVLRVKPISKVSALGFEQVGVETYGGGLWNTWFDRDLSVAGRAIVDVGGRFESRLVRIRKSILSIPSLAIHLNRSIYEEGFKPNFETHLIPILATQVKQALLVQEKKDEEKPLHNTLLLQMLAKELGVDVSQIRDFELSLYDTNPSAITGAADEFISSARLDNLCMSFCSLEALLSTLASLGTDSLIRVVTLFDHEEVGSDSAQGAGSNMMHTLFTRISGADRVHSAIRKSMLVSADMAHACHPNYPEKHEANHRPRMHEGLVFKFNAKQRYATDAVSSFILKEIARCRKVPVQHFCVRNDVGCGSTIGPILASNTGIRVIDVGVPQFAMHSIRELCAVDDVAHAVDLLAGFFEDFASIDNNLKVD